MGRRRGRSPLGRARGQRRTPAPRRAPAGAGRARRGPGPALAAGDPGGQRHRALPDPLPAGPGAGSRAAAPHRRSDRHAGRPQRGHRGGHAAAGAGLRHPRGVGDPGPRRCPVARAVVAVGALPRRGARPADAGRVPTCAGTVVDDPPDHRRLPAPEHGDPARRLRQLGRPRAGRHAVGRPGRGDRGAPARRRRPRPAHRAGGAAPRARGLLAAATGGRRVPRRRRGRGGLRAAQRGPRRPRRRAARGRRARCRSRAPGRPRPVADPPGTAGPGAARPRPGGAGAGADRAHRALGLRQVDAPVAAGRAARADGRSPHAWRRAPGGHRAVVAAPGRLAAPAPGLRGGHDRRQPAAGPQRGR